MKVTFGDTPFVGRLGNINEIRIVERAGDLICETTRSIVILTLLLSFVWGGFLTYLVWASIIGRMAAHAPRSAQTPWFVICFMAVLGLVCWISFFRALLGAPYFEVSGATGEFSFFRRRTRKPWKTMAASEISNFTIEKQFYLSKHRQTDNAVLILFTNAGERFPLCASPNKTLIASLGEKLANRTQRKIETSVAT